MVENQGVAQEGGSVMAQTGVFITSAYERLRDAGFDSPEQGELGETLRWLARAVEDQVASEYAADLRACQRERDELRRRLAEPE